MLLPPAMLDESIAARLQIDRAVLEQHWQRLRGLSLSEQQALQEKLYELYSEIGFIERTDPEQMLYDGFFNESDKKRMLQVRRATPAQLASQSFDFVDKRLEVLLFRYRARNFQHTLSLVEQQQWQAFCYSRRTDPSAGASLQLDTLKFRVAELLQMETTSALQKNILNDLMNYAEGL
jgi:exodeoxyribonuclease-1